MTVSGAGKHIATFVVSEVFGYGQCRMTYPEARAGWLVHLTEYHDGAIEYARCLHVPIQLFRLTTPLTNPAKQAYALVATGHVVNELSD